MSQQTKATPLPAVLEIGQRYDLRPLDLSPHPKLEAHPFDQGTLVQMRGTIPSMGVLEELLITKDKLIANGRHRWRGAILADLATKAVLPCRVIDEDEVDEIILTTLSARKHYSRSAVAYLARPHIEAAILHAKEARKRTQFGGDLINKVTGANGSTFKDIAEMLNVSVGTLELASKTVQLFKESDQRRQKWLHNHTDEAERWETWRSEQEDGADSWQTWRAQRLTDMRHNVNDPKCAVIIPEDFREVYEAKLFSVEPGESMGLGAINKAVGSALATKGGGRSDLQADSPAASAVLGNKLASFSKTMFGPAWQGMGIDERMGLAQGIAEAATSWPDEVRMAIVSRLTAKAKP